MTKTWWQICVCAAKGRGNIWVKERVLLARREMSCHKKKKNRWRATRVHIYDVYTPQRRVKEKVRASVSFYFFFIDIFWLLFSKNIAQCVIPPHVTAIYLSSLTIPSLFFFSLSLNFTFICPVRFAALYIFLSFFCTFFLFIFNLFASL